jgi:Flp pilus assembly protein TadG
VADIIFNIAKGKIAYFAELGAANDALIMVPIETTGIVSDATMRDYATLDAVLAGASNEQTTMGRKTLASVTVTVDNTNDRVDIDCADVTWTAATGNAISAVLICYDGDTTAGTDANIIPISKHDFVVTPNGGDIVAQIAASGFARAS